MPDTLGPLLELLRLDVPLVQAMILTREGSTPRSAGSRMLLAGDGPGGLRIAAGTVGGGLVEARVMAAGAEVLADGRRRVEFFDLTGGLAAGTDMVCGGRLSVFLERLDAADLPLFSELAAALAKGQRRLRLTPLDGGPSLLLDPSAPADSDCAGAALRAGGGVSAPVILEHAGRAYALEPCAAASPLIIFGAGHVSRPTAQIAALAGFRVLVLDDRPEFASRERFPQAETLVLAGFADCFTGLRLRIGPEAFVVIVTRGHAHDADVLAQALRTDAGYIGMIGSRRKRDAVYARLRGQGFTDADLGRVRCPIGLSIGAETPEEIAVSIVAELVAHRAGKSAERGWA